MRRGTSLVKDDGGVGDDCIYLRGVEVEKKQKWVIEKRACVSQAKKKKWTKDIDIEKSWTIIK